MAFESISPLKKNRVYAPILAGLAILLAIVFVRPAFGSYSEAQTALELAKKSHEETTITLEKYKKQEKKIAP